MSLVPLNKLFQDQQGKLVRASVKRAVINSVNVAAQTADVYFVENPQTVIRNIPLASNINASTVSPGMTCRVDTFDETNPNNMVISYILGQPAVATLNLVNVPATATSSGTPGQVAYDTGFFYVCVSVNVWRKVAIASW